jgi:GT2 family glycosyltransferase
MTQASPTASSVAVVVPVYNAAAYLPDCLDAISRSLPTAALIVADDGSTDDSAAIAERHGAQVVRLEGRSGPAGARNRGVAETRADVVCFVDSDVVVADDALRRMVERLATDPDTVAVFGSYDTNPRATGLVSRFRNLLHHYVHQRGSREASTFWAGCGAIRREAFDEVGGFERHWNGIEDIELGYRLRAAGYRIALDPSIQCTHLKRWTLRSMLWTDIRSRAYLWARLILERKSLPSDLNVDTAQRVSLALVAVALAGLAFVWWVPSLLILSALAVAGVVWLNRDLYRYLASHAGIGFALASIPLHLLHLLAGGLGLVAAMVAHAAGNRR